MKASIYELLAIDDAEMSLKHISIWCNLILMFPYEALNLKFDQVMFDSLFLTWKRKFEVTFGIFSVLVFQINVLESYLDIYLF